MPYIKDQNMRKKLSNIVDKFADELMINDESLTGNLNFFLFKIAKDYCHTYKDFSIFIGELESAKLEIYRRLVAPYEDKKIEENGDVK